MNNQLATTNGLSINDISTVSETFFKSGMFKDCTSAAQAMVKIMAGAEIGLPAFQSMSGIHIIQGKPTIGAGLMAAKVKGSGKYDYKVIEQSEKICSIDFFQGKDKIGNSTFTIEQAKAAATQNLQKFPANMLFARAISNGVKWYCPDVFAGPVYTPEEMPQVETIDTEYTEEVKPLPILKVGTKAFNSAVKAMREGKTIEDVRAVANVSDEVEIELLNAVESAA